MNSALYVALACIAVFALVPLLCLPTGSACRRCGAMNAAECDCEYIDVNGSSE